MKKLLLIFSALMILHSCNILKYTGKEKAGAVNFKTGMPFKIEKDQAILVPARIGSSKQQFDLHFDTHAMQSAFVEGGNVSKVSSFKYLGSSSIKMRTITGEKIDRKFYGIDSLYLGDLVFNNVALFQIPKDSLRDTVKFARHDGILGVDLLSHGVWKIDFETNKITFASSIDSIQDITDKMQIGEGNIFGIFKVEGLFDNKIKIDVSVDFGASTTVFLKLKDMKRLKKFPASQITKSSVQTVAGVSELTFYSLTEENIKINDHEYPVKIISCDKQKKNLLGLGFFRKFKYVILDYPNNKIYVSGSLRNS